MELESSYALIFTAGSLALAHDQLSPKVHHYWAYIRLGLHIGLCIAFCAWTFWDGVFSPSTKVDLFLRPVIAIYECMGGFLWLMWFWAANLLVWKRFDIDYASILGFEPETMYSSMEVLTEVSWASITLLCNLLLYFKLLNNKAGKKAPRNHPISALSPAPDNFSTSHVGLSIRSQGCSNTFRPPQSLSC